MTDSVDGLTEALKQFAQERDWGQFHSPKNLASALIVEAGELLEHFQWLTEEQSRALSDERRAAVAAEVADVLLYLLQLSSALGIDPIAAAQAKLRINAQKYPVERARGTPRNAPPAPATRCSSLPRRWPGRRAPACLATGAGAWGWRGGR